jgi:UPF0716 protein FxsA
MLKLLFLFTVVPTIELYLLFAIADNIGGIETLYLVIFTGIVGAHLAKREGLGVLKQIQEGAASGVPPADKLVEGLMVLVGGILLVTPGVMTDLFGFALITPLSRRMMVGAVKRNLAQRVNFEGVVMGTPRPGPASGGAPHVVVPPKAEPEPEVDPDSPFKHPVR